MRFIFDKGKLYICNFPMSKEDYELERNNTLTMHKVLPELFLLDIEMYSRTQHDLLRLYGEMYEPVNMYMKICEVDRNAFLGEDIRLTDVNKTIKNVFKAIYQLHDSGFYHGNLHYNCVLFNPEIKFIHNLNSGYIPRTWTEVTNLKINFHLQVMYQSMPPLMFKFLDLFLFTKSINESMHINLNDYLFSEELKDFVTMTYVLQNASFKVLTMKLGDLSSLFGQIPFSNHKDLDLEIHKWNLMFQDIHKYNNDNLHVWIDNTIYTDYEYYYKTYSRLYRGQELFTNEYVKVQYMKTISSHFSLIHQVSGEMLIGKYMSEYYPLKLWPLSVEKIEAVIKVIEDDFIPNNFFHGNLTNSNIMIHIDSCDVQIINSQYSKFLLDCNIITKDDVTLGLLEDTSLNKEFLFFIDMFKFAFSVYHPGLKGFTTKNANFLLSWQLIDDMLDYDRQCFRPMVNEIKDLLEE